MAPNAMGLLRVHHCYSLPAQDVYFNRHLLQMFRVYTPAIPTEAVNGQGWD